MAEEKKQTTFMTPVFRVSFPAVFKARAAVKGAEEKFSISMLFPKKFDQDTVGGQLKYGAKSDKALFDKIVAAVSAAAAEKWGADKAKWPKGLKPPFHDGSEKDYDGYGPDVIFASASSKIQPGLIDHNKAEIIDAKEFQGGDYARATITVYAYDNVSKGVAFGLRNIQKAYDGEHFSGGAKAVDEFDAIPMPAGSAAEMAPVGGAVSSDPLGL